MGALVTTALRMTPRWLVVGEIRSGAAALWLFRAQMSDHPGLSTLHSDSPTSAIGTLGLLAQLTEEHVPFQRHQVSHGPRRRSDRADRL